MKNSVKTVSSIFVIILLSKILGQVREIIFASYYGTGDVANAFLTASQIPLNFFDIILGMAIVSAFIPVFNEYREKHGEIKAMDFSYDFVGVVFTVAFIVTLLGVVFSFNLVSIIAAGLNYETTVLASKLLKILFPSMIFTALAYSYTGILQSYGEFKIPAAMSLVSNLIAILYLFVFNDKYGIFGLSIAMLIGWILQLVILIPPLLKRKYKFVVKFNFLSEGMKKVYRLALPIFLSSWVQPINVMVNTYLASFLNGGQAVSALNYANKLYLIIVSVFATSVTNLILPNLSRLFVSKEFKKCNEVIENSLNATILFLLPVTGLFLMFRVPVVEIIFQRGSFDANSTLLTSKALFYYSLGMLGYGVSEILNKSFYSMQKSKIPMRVALMSICVNLALSFILSRYIGIGGLGLAASVSSTFSALMLFFFLKREISDFNIKNILICFIKGFGSVVVAMVATNFVYNLLFDIFAKGVIYKLLVLCLCGITCVIIYLVTLYILKTKEIRRGDIWQKK